MITFLASSTYVANGFNVISLVLISISDHLENMFTYKDLFFLLHSLNIQDRHQNLKFRANKVTYRQLLGLNITAELPCSKLSLTFVVV